MTTHGDIGGIRNQVAATLCACLTATSWGVNYGITSAVIFEFQKDKDDHVKMSLEDASWMPTLFALATVPGHLLGGCIADKWGRIRTIFIFNLISYVFWLATAFGNDRYLLYLTYALQGFFGSISYNVVSVFIAEAADPSLRRMLVPFNSISYSLGHLLAYTTSAFLSWRTSKLLLGSFITLPGAILILLVHETPHWLVKRCKFDEARNSMMFYRGNNERRWEREFQSIIEMAEDRIKKIDKERHVHFLLSVDFLRAFKCVGILRMMFSLSGIYTINTYTDTFMELASGHAGKSISPEQQAIIEGVVEVIASIFSPLAFLKFRKRTIYIMCTVVASLSMAAVAIFNHLSIELLKEAGDFVKSSSGFVPLVACHIPAICNGCLIQRHNIQKHEFRINVIGIRPTLFLLSGELFPTDIRASACGIVMAMGKITMVANYKFFPMATAAFGFHYVLYFYALSSALMAVWGLLTIQDTDKLSLTEVQELLKRNEVQSEEKKKLLLQKS